MSTLLYETASLLWQDQPIAILRVASHLEDDTDPNSPGCSATTSGLTDDYVYLCTRAEGHANWHVARGLNGETIIAVWTDGPTVGATDAS